MSITEAVAAKEPRKMRDVLLSAVETMERRNAGELAGLKTGLDQIDEMLSGGLKPGNLVIIAGRPGMGKTALALQFAIEAAQSGTTALVLSMEMCEGELADRLIANVGHVPLKAVLSGAMIAFVYRDEVYNERSPDRGTAEIIIGKNRQGKPGMVRTAYIGDQTRFAPLAQGWAPAEKDVPFAKSRRGFRD